MFKVSINPCCKKKKPEDEYTPSFDVVLPPPPLTNRSANAPSPSTMVPGPKAEPEPEPEPESEPEPPLVHTPPGSPRSVAEFEVIDA